MPTVIVAVALSCLIGLLYAEKKERLTLRLLFKPLLSSLFVLVALMQKGLLMGYFGGILAGLVLSWIGDFCLIYDSRRMFLSGLIAFLCAHICYGAIFYSHGAFGIYAIAGAAAAAPAGAVIFGWLRPHLGQMTVPVIGYMIVITLMLVGALTLFFTPTVADRRRYLVIAGAVLFYLSDIFVARDKFVAPGFINRAAGLPLYFSAQFFFALSI